MRILELLFSMLLLLFGGCATHNSLQSNKIIVKKFAYRPITEQVSLGDIEREMEAALLFSQQEGKDSLQLLVDDLFLKGNDAALRGKGKLALLYFKYAHKAMPKEVYLHQKYAFQLVKMGQLEQAEKELEYLVANNPSNEKWQMVLAGVYTAQNKMKLAQKIYEKWLVKSKNTAGVCLSLNSLYVMQKQYKRSLKLLRNCRKMAKTSSEKMDYVFYRAKNYIQQGKNTVAFKILQRIVHQDPKYQQAWLTWGLMLEEKKQFKQAIKLYKKALRYAEDNYVILSRLTNLMIVQGQIKDAIPYLTRLVDLDPDNLGSLIKLGIAQSDAHNLKEARNTFLAILKRVPTSDKVLYYLGVLSIEMHDLEGSLDYFAKIPDDSSFFIDSSLQMANVLLALAHNPEKKHLTYKTIEQKLLQLLSRGEALKNYQFQLSLKLAGFYENRGEIKKAIAMLKNIEHFPEYTADHIYYMAALYEKLGEPAKARALVAEVIKKDPTNAQAYNFYGYSLLEEGKEMAKAYQYISKAVELAPKDAYIRDSLGWYYFKMNKFKDALKHITIAYRTVSSEPAIVLHLAKIYAKLKKMKKAKLFYTKAIKLSTNKAEKEKLQQEMKDFGIWEQRNRLPASNN